MFAHTPAVVNVHADDVCQDRSGISPARCRRAARRSCLLVRVWVVKCVDGRRVVRLDVWGGAWAR